MTHTSRKTAAQQAELDALRAKKACAAETVFAESTVAHDVKIDDEFAMFKMAKGLLAGANLPSWKRVVLGLLVGLAAGAGVAYITNMVVGILIAGAAATTTYFIGMTLAVIAALIGAYLAMKSAVKAFSYIASSSINDDYTAAKNKISGWFASKPVVAAA